jgi:hypothetical protein
MTFKENQRFTQPWLWFILVLVALLPVYGLYVQVYMGQEFGNNPMSNTGLIVLAIALLGMIAFFGYMRLRSIYDQEGIRMSFRPFMQKKLSWDSIQSAEIVDYGFVGYGIRMSRKYGTVYNTNGSKGVYLVLGNGKRFVIGTQAPEELSKVLENYLGKRFVKN